MVLRIYRDAVAADIQCRRKRKFFAPELPRYRDQGKRSRSPGTTGVKDPIETLPPPTTSTPRHNQ